MKDPRWSHGELMEVDPDRFDKLTCSSLRLLPQRQAGPYKVAPEWRAKIKGLLVEAVEEVNAQYPRTSPVVQHGHSRIEGSGFAVLMADGDLPVCQVSEDVRREVAHIHAVSNPL